MALLSYEMDSLSQGYTIWDEFILCTSSWNSYQEPKTHLAVLDPEKKAVWTVFSLLNIRHPQKFKAGQPLAK